MERTELVVRLAALIQGVAGEKLTDVEVAESLGKLVVDIRADTQMQLVGVPVPEAQAPKSDAQSVMEVFSYWKSMTGHTTARMLPERAQKIRARLRHFTVVDLKQAVDGVMLSAHHMGDNASGEQYNWIETIFKTNSTVEQHMARARSSISAPTKQERSPRAAELKAEIEDAKRHGDVARTNRLNTELRDLLQKPVS